jgi:hypothetical protein
MGHDDEDRTEKIDQQNFHGGVGPVSRGQRCRRGQVPKVGWPTFSDVLRWVVLSAGRRFAGGKNWD